MDKKGQKGAPGLDAMKARTAEHKAKRGVKEEVKLEGYYDSAVAASKAASKGNKPKVSLKDRIKSVAKKAIASTSSAAGKAVKVKSDIQAAPGKAKKKVTSYVDRVKGIAKAGYKSGRGPVEKTTTYRGAGAGRKEKIGEDFVTEVIEKDNPDANVKKIDVMKGKNKVKINPNMGEQVETDTKQPEDVGLKQKERQANMLKKRVLMQKLKAVRSGAGDSIMASHTPQGEVVEASGCGTEITNKGKRKVDPKKNPVIEAKVDQGRSDYGKASIRNYRRSGPGHGEPAMFDSENKRGKTIDKRREEHKERRGVKGAKVPAYKTEEAQLTETDKKGKGSGTKDACYHKVKSRYSVWPSAYASGALVKCRKKGAANWGNSKKEEFEGWADDPILEKVAAWQRKEGKRESGGLNQKGVDSYRRENPGSKLKTAVTTKPSKLKKGSKSANRRKSFCARMSGMKKKLTSAKTANDPDSRINKSLRKWNCSYEPEGTPIMEKDAALDFVRKQIEKKHGKGAIYDGKSKSKSPSPAEKAKASAERKKRQDADNKAYASRAKKAGYKSTQDYTNVVARYGSEDNYRKGKGLGT